MKTQFVPFELGKCARHYDALSEEASPKDEEEIAEILSWVHGVPKKFKKRAQRENKAVHELISTLQQGLLPNYPITFMEVIKDVYYGVRDFFSGLRMKSSLTILGSIGIGAALGFVLGTFVFPGPGSVVGAAVGSAIGGMLTTILSLTGGVIGLSILGAFVGGVFGKKASEKLFKHEKRFEVSSRVTRKIKKRTGIKRKTVQMINGYLYNRRQTIKSPLCKKYYKLLRREGIFNADPIYMDKIVHFFCNELILLRKEATVQVKNDALEQEIKTVRYLLEQFKKSTKLDEETLAKVNHILQADLNDQFVRDQKTFVPHTKTIKSMNRLPLSPSKTEKVGYELKTTSLKDKAMMPALTLEKSELTERTTQYMLHTLLENAKTYLMKLEDRTVMVHAAKDDNLAIQLYAAALKASLMPQLDEQEYPDNSQAARARKEEIIKQAFSLAKMEAPKKRIKLGPRDPLQ